MDIKLIYRLLLSITLCLKCAAGYNDFPSLIAANATMAIVIEKGFFIIDDEYKSTLRDIQSAVDKIVKKNMKMGGIILKVFPNIEVNFKKDFTAVLLIGTCQSTWNLYKNLKREELLFLSVTDPDCPRLPGDVGISVPMVQPGGELAQIFIDLRMSKILNWPTINFIHDETFARDTIRQCVKALSIELPDKSLTLASQAIFSAKFDKEENTVRKDVHSILSNFNVNELGRMFIVIVNIEHVIVVMDVARSLNMVKPDSQWLYVISGSKNESFNMSSFAQVLAEGENLAFLHNDTTFTRNCRMGLLCHVRELIEALAVSLEKSLLSEIELYKTVLEEEFEIVRLSKAERKQEILSNMNEQLDQMRHEYSSRMCGECISWKMTSAVTWGTSFQRNKNSDETVVGNFLHSGVWSPGPGVNMSTPLFPHIKYGFLGINLPIATYENPPWQIMVEPDVKQFKGLTFEILKSLSEKLNFTYTIEIPMSNEKKGRKSQNIGLSVAKKIPESMIGLIETKKIFIAAIAITVSETKKKINYTWPISTQTYTLLSARPEQLSRVFLFIAPFSPATWGVLVATIVVIGIILRIMVRFNPKPLAMYEYPVLTSLWQCSWYIYGALLQQGGLTLPRADSPRLVIGTWWVGVMVIVATYSGNLIAFLTFPMTDMPINALEDLIARQEEFTWGYANGSAVADFLEASDSQINKDIVSGAQIHDPDDFMDILEHIKSDKHVLIDWKSTITFLTKSDFRATQKCNFYVSPDEFIDENLAMIVASENPYLPMINKEIQKLHESGLIAKWLSDLIPLKDECYADVNAMQEATNHRVDLIDMQGIFFLLGLGIVASGIIIIFEFGMSKRKEMMEKKLIRPFLS